eukprot:5683540-Amphidinium_carterae.1
MRITDGEDESSDRSRNVLVCASIAPDADRRSWLAVQRSLEQDETVEVLLDSPPGVLAQETCEWLTQKGWHVVQEDVLCTELGDAVSQRKILILASRSPIAERDWLQRPLADSPRALPMSVYLLGAQRLEEEHWMSEGEKVNLEPRASAGRSPCLPRLMGHWVSRSTGKKTKLYDAQGPTPTLNLMREQAQGHGSARGPGIWIYDRKGRKSGVRELLPYEVYKLHGGREEEWMHGI